VVRGKESTDSRPPNVYERHSINQKMQLEQNLLIIDIQVTGLIFFEFMRRKAFFSPKWFCLKITAPLTCRQRRTPRKMF
jgi:hypothetical protein